MRFCTVWPIKHGLATIGYSQFNMRLAGVILLGMVYAYSYLPVGFRLMTPDDFAEKKTFLPVQNPFFQGKFAQSVQQLRHKSHQKRYFYSDKPLKH